MRRGSLGTGHLRLGNTVLPAWTSIRESGKGYQSPSRGHCPGTTGHSQSRSSSAETEKVMLWDLGREGPFGDLLVGGGPGSKGLVPEIRQSGGS